MLTLSTIKLITSLNIKKVEFIIIFKRFGHLPKVPKSLLHLLENKVTVPTTAVANNLFVYNNLKDIKNKLALYYFCDHFEKLPVSDLLDDKKFIMYFHNLTKEKPFLLGRMLQLSVESSYAKRKFSNNDLSRIFTNEFSIKNIIDSTNPIIDSSTFYNTLQLSHLYNNSPVGKLCLELLATPINFFNIKDLPLNLQKKLLQFKALTGNLIPDLLINGVPYDWKNSKEYYYLKNHIYFIDFETVMFRGNKILYEIGVAFKQQLNILSKDKPKFNIEITYIEKCYDKIVEISMEKATLIEKFYRWSLYLQENVDTRPDGIGIALFHPGTQTAFVPEISEVTNVTGVELPVGNSDVVKVKQAIMGIIKFKPPLVQVAAAISTNNVIDCNVNESSDI